MRYCRSNIIFTLVCVSIISAAQLFLLPVESAKADEQITLSLVEQRDLGTIMVSGIVYLIENESILRRFEVRGNARIITIGCTWKLHFKAVAISPIFFAKNSEQECRGGLIEFEFTRRPYSEMLGAVIVNDGENELPAGVRSIVSNLALEEKRIYLTMHNNLQAALQVSDNAAAAQISNEIYWYVAVTNKQSKFAEPYRLLSLTTAGQAVGISDPLKLDVNSGTYQLTQVAVKAISKFNYDSAITNLHSFGSETGVAMTGLTPYQIQNESVSIQKYVPSFSGLNLGAKVRENFIAQSLP